MYNRKVLIDALKKLGSAKAPTEKKNIIVDPMGQWAHPGEITRIPSNNITMDNVPYPVYADPNVGSSRMMYPEQEYNFPGASHVDEYPMMRSGGNKSKHVVVKQSKIPEADKGLFSNQGFRKNQIIGLAHRDGQPVGKIGNMHNHSENPNMYSVKQGNKRYVYAKRDIQPGEELTTNYRLQPELEQPEDFMKKGGSAPKLPNKKNPRAYSRSLEATNRLFARHPWFAKSKSRKNKIYDPNAKYYQLGGLTRFVPQAGRMFALPPITNTIANTAPGILNSIKTISQKLPTNLLDEGTRDLLHYPSFDVTLGESNLTGVDAAKYLGDFDFKPYSEGWTALSDMKNAFEGEQWNPSKEDFYTDDEVVDLVNKEIDYRNTLNTFDEMNPEPPGMEIMRALSGDTSRDELFSNLFPDAYLPNFRSKILSPEQSAYLNEIGLSNITFTNRGMLNKSSLRSLTKGEDVLPSTYKDLLKFKKDNWLQKAPAKDVVMEMRGSLGLKMEDIKNATPEKFETWRQEIVKKMYNQALQRWQNESAGPLKGLDAYNQIINRTGSRNKYGGELPKGKYGYSVGNLIRKQDGGEPKDYQGGGETGCPEGYAFNPITGECVEWTPTVWNSEDQPTAFDPIADVIYMNPNDRPEGMSDEEYNQMYQDQLEHEQLHRLQWINDGLKGENKTPLRMPSTVDNQDYPGDHYYNRRQEEVNYLHDYWKNQHPDEAEFIPDEVIYNKETDPAMYELPWTVEGEARDYENATRSGMESFFPKRKLGGQLRRAQSGGLTGMGKYPALTATPFDFRTSYGQTSDFNKNPNYSLTYTVPKLFKKAGLAGNPLSFTLGRPYNTDAESLTNRTLNFIPQEGLFSSYYDPATQGASNPQYQQYLQDVSDTTGTPVSELNQTVINQYNAAKNLAGAKPSYKKGIPLTANIGWDAYGTAFGDRSSGPFTGYGSLNAGYAPEPGFYGTADLGIMGVFGKRKNNASIKPQTYFNKGLTKQGDRAFIPKLNILNFAVRQRPEYNDIQTQQALDLYQKDIEQGTTTAAEFLKNKTDEERFDLSFISPEATFQIKPFKNIPGVASITGGLRFDYGGKDTSGDRIPITPKPYGNVRYTVPLDVELPKNKIAHLFDKGVMDRDGHFRIPKKTYNDYAYDQDYDEEYIDEYTGDTPEEETPTENNFEVNPPEVELNFDGQGVGKADCPKGYERPCEKCRCQKIKIPQMYMDKRGTHLFGNEPIRFQDGGEPKDYQAFLEYSKTAPENRQPLPSYVYGDPNDYDHYGMWEALGKPKNFEEALQMNPDWQPDAYDGMYHGFSVNPETGVFLKSGKPGLKEGDTTWMEIAGHYLSPRANESTPVFDIDLQRFKYIPKEEDGGDIELELTQKEIDKYVKGGYIIEDISVPKLSMKRGGELPKAQLGEIVKGGGKALSTLAKIDKLHIDDFANLSEIIKNSSFSYPLTIEAPSGFMKLIPNDPKNIDQNLWHFLADMPNQREAGKAFYMFNQILPPKPSLLETDSLSLDSLGTLLNVGKKKDWISKYENDVHLNSMSKNSDLFKGLAIPTTPYGLRDDLADQMVTRLTDFIKSKGYEEDAYRFSPPGVSNMNKIYVPNYKLTRTWKLGGESNYELGDEVDEATMKQLKKLGYTFEKI